MKARAAPEFWECYEALPRKVQNQAQAAYRMWSADPYHRSLEFKRIKGAKHPVRSVRIGLHWRALCIVGVRS